MCTLRHRSTRTGHKWLSVGLYLYPINTIAQKLWSVAYSYAVHILAAYPGHHKHHDHPTAHFNVLDEDYDIDDHPFRTHFLHTRHYVPNTHYLARQRHAAITGKPNHPHITMSLPRLYKRFRNLMRLKGVLRAIVFTIRAHLAAIRRRAYTNELLRRQAPSLLTITNPIIHTTSNLFPTPNPATSRDYTPPTYSQTSPTISSSDTAALSTTPDRTTTSSNHLSSPPNLPYTPHLN